MTFASHDRITAQLSSGCPAVTAQPSNGRSAVTNRTRLHDRKSLVDGRTAPARRFRDALASILSGLGDPSSISDADRTLARNAAALTVTAEELEARVARGEQVDPNHPDQDQ